jgi:hypothetical protein
MEMLNQQSNSTGRLKQSTIPIHLIFFALKVLEEKERKHPFKEGEGQYNNSSTYPSKKNMVGINPAASANTFTCCGVRERMGNIIIPCGSKILRNLLRRASITCSIRR